ncbi:hypothetical protein H1P_2670009 [Hyella patelloides LEGE 07179]|uniref:Uncharacterized protein n=1 Tax=Hyella patelloides LEGE 07179 TaxID=945734 RepID=A0A563VSW6_9CYAN|nr:hypothetical protein H1P_2670009 [Hyella patelloides LEGE 07179]
MINALWHLRLGHRPFKLGNLGTTVRDQRLMASKVRTRE